MKDINEIKETIKKLQKITFENNASEGEVENAARIVQNLLIKYHLELNNKTKIYSDTEGFEFLGFKFI